MIEYNLYGLAMDDLTGSYARLLVEKTNTKDYEHPKVFSAIESIVKRGENPTFEMLCSDHPNLLEFFKKARGQTCEFEPSVLRLKVFSKIKKHKALAAELLKISQSGDSSFSEIESAISKHEEKIAGLLKEKYTSNEAFLLQDWLPKYFEIKANQIKDNGTQGVLTGFPKLDKMVGGFREGELITIAGRPSMGKTSFALSCYVWQLLNGYKPLYIALEVASKAEFYDKVFSMISKLKTSIIPYCVLRNPYGNKTMLQTMMEITKYIQNSKSLLYVEPGTTFEDTRAMIRDLSRKNEMDIVYIDQLSLLVKDKKYEREELSMMSGGYKQLSKEVGRPIVMINQLSRDAEAKGIPQLSHLKGSGSIEEDSDMVFFPWRECVINRDKAKTEALLIPAKGRNFDNEPLIFDFCTQTTLFTEREGI
jgi:replicative DNA helicase